MRYALEQGCRAIHTCTGEEVPGDPQHSCANILKAGFVEDHVVANYAPPKRGQGRTPRDGRNLTLARRAGPGPAWAAGSGGARRARRCSRHSR